MIRCDLYKGKSHRFGGVGGSNFVEPGRDAQPRKDDPGVVVDHGNVGELGGGKRDRRISHIHVL